MSDLCIYGSGGHGREILQLSQTINSIGNRWNKIYFVVDTQVKQNECEIEWVNNTQVLSFEYVCRNFSRENTEFVIGVGEPAFREIMFNKIKGNGFKFAELIHPSVIIPDNTELGVGCVICMYVYISVNAILGNNVCIQPFATVSHDCVIGEHTIISSSASLAGHTRIGRVSYVGLNAAIREKTVIGDNTIVGMGSVVIRDIPDKTVVVGNPAKPIQQNTLRKVFRSV